MIIDSLLAEDMTGTLCIYKSLAMVHCTNLKVVQNALPV